MLPEKGSYDRKIFRLLYILNKLDTDKRVFTRDLAREFNVSHRTVQRDLELLNMTGFPLYSSEKGCNSFADDFSLKKVMLSGEEASMLSFLYDIARSLGKNFEKSFKDILRKVLTQDKEQPFYIKIPTGMKMNGEFSFIKELERAIEESKRVGMCYSAQGKEKSIKADPLKIIFFDGFWYLLAKPEDKVGIRKYRLDHITKIKTLNEHFKIHENLKTMLDESVNVWFSGKRDKKIVVEVSGDVAKYFKQRKYFPLQKIKKQLKDGSLLIESKVGQFMEVLPTIKAWMPCIKVLEPKELREELKTLVKEYLKTI